MEKKTETIVVKTTKEMREKIEKYAQKRDWTISQSCHNIIKEVLEKEERK